VRKHVQILLKLGEALILSLRGFGLDILTSWEERAIKHLLHNYALHTSMLVSTILVTQFDPSVNSKYNNVLQWGILKTNKLACCKVATCIGLCAHKTPEVGGFREVLPLYNIWHLRDHQMGLGHCKMAACMAVCMHELSSWRFWEGPSAIIPKPRYMNHFDIY
jgi:hypothetical protein